MCPFIYGNHIPVLDGSGSSSGEGAIPLEIAIYMDDCWALIASNPPCCPCLRSELRFVDPAEMFYNILSGVHPRVKFTKTHTKKANGLIPVSTSIKRSEKRR